MVICSARILAGEKRHILLNYAIIGCGAIGARHAELAAGTGKLLAVCDIVEEKANNLAKKHQAKAYFDIGDLLKQEGAIQVIAICTPNGLHAEHSISALQAGFHVICEKPMALRTIDCTRMIEAAERAGKNLFIVKQNRFNPPVIAVKKMLDEGRLGRIYSVQVNCCWNRTAAYYRNSWHGSRDMDGGILYTQFSHFIDLLYWMMGNVQEATAFTSNFAHGGNIDFEDVGVASLKFKTGALGSLHFTINSHKKNMEGSITIVAEKGTVKIGGEYLNSLEYMSVDGEVLPILPQGNPSNNYGSYQGSMSNHDKMYSHVVDVLTKGQTNLFSGEEGLKTVEIIEKIYKAAK
jgi:predicted dehydrogenase